MVDNVCDATRRELRLSAILFGLLVAAFCAWVLSLPVFPSNDGPAHKFYAGVLGAEIFGDRYGDAFRMRLPVPPYASQDYILALTSRVMDINLGEKLFVCLVIAGTAFAVRLCCVQMGPSGGWASLFVMPLLRRLGGAAYVFASRTPVDALSAVWIRSAGPSRIRESL
jgi:hypothetical protein